MKRLLLFLLLLTSKASESYKKPAELISDFHSKITIQPDATLTVTETITIQALHHKIKRGITRAFPTTYKTKYGGTVTAGFKVIEVLMDGRPCPYFITNATNGKIINTGDDQFITKGLHTYQLTYETNRQLTFSKNWTELYFNIVGNNVIFPILKASATIYLPTTISPQQIELAGYTGFYGNKHTDYHAWISDPNICHFETTQPLLPQQSFTISVAFPTSSSICAPTFLTKLKWFIKDHLDLLILLICSLFLLLIYGLAWFNIVSKKPIIVPLFSPPDGMLPADCLYLYNKGFTNTALTTAIIDMAVHGCLKIKSQPGSWLTGGGTSFSLIKSIPIPATAIPKYTQLTEILFSKTTEISLDRSNYLTINKLLEQLKLITSNYNLYIKETSTTLIVGIISSIIASIWAFAVMQNELLLVFLTLIVGINIAAIYVLPDYTDAGKELYAKIAGFKMYLSYTEKDRFNRLNSPTMTIELFEKYLPYAIALGVDQHWTRAFNSIYIQANGTTYHPTWWMHHRFNIHSLNSELNHFNTSINNAITTPKHAPGTTSGRGGGGFSGGGGGGGGIGGR